MGDRRPDLRPYQSAAIAAVEREFEAGRRSTLLVQATGTGKTVVFSEVVRREVDAGGSALVVAHRTELLEQAIAKLAAVGVRASLEQGERTGSLRSRVVVGSVQSLRGKRLDRYPVDAFSLIVLDEAHHAAAKSYGSILERFAGARVLGVTATPDRADGRGLGEVFETVAFTYDLRTAIREKYLAPIRARRVQVAELDLSRVRSHHGDFDQGELAALLADEKALHGVVSPLLELAGRRRTVVFGVDVAHAHALAEVLNRHRPACAIAVDGSAKAAERKAALSLFRDGTFQFLVNCALFTEGFDEPSIECVAMARPTQSRGLYTQMLGRGTRLHPGKEDVLVLDFVGVTRHRLVGPADALAGALDPAAAAAVDRVLADNPGLDVEAALALAEDLVAGKVRDAKLLAVVEYRAREIDPFLGDQMRPSSNEAWANDPASDAQLAALDKAGMSRPPPGFTKGEASRMLDAIAERRRLGLATIPQCRLLERLGVNTRGMTMARATQLILKCKAVRFHPSTLMHEPEFRRGRRS